MAISLDISLLVFCIFSLFGIMHYPASEINLGDKRIK